MAYNPNIPAPTNRVQDDIAAMRGNFQHLAPLAQLAPAAGELQAVSALAPYVQALLDSRIVEMGSNSNGEYVRRENGLQVCWNATNVGPANVFGSGTLGDMYRSEVLNPSFPARFQTPPYVVPFAYRPESSGGERPVGSSYSVVTSSGVVGLQVWSFSSDSSDVILGYLAIGRWK